jgi:ferredoxin
MRMFFEGKCVRVSLSKSDGSFSATPEMSVLDAALEAGLNLPHSCKGGNCGACRTRLLQGEIRYPNGPPLGLSDAEVKEGFVLLCQARARTDLIIENIAVSTPDEALIKRLPGRIERMPSACRTTSWACTYACPPLSRFISSRASISTSCCPAAGVAAFQLPRRRTTRACWNCMCAGSTGEN